MKNEKNFIDSLAIVFEKMLDIKFKEETDNKKEIVNNEGQWRIKVLTRDNFTCKLCGYKPARIAHHISSRNYYPNIKWDIENGLTVCDKCHQTYHRGNL